MINSEIIELERINVLLNHFILILLNCCLKQRHPFLICCSFLTYTALKHYLNSVFSEFLIKFIKRQL